MTEDWMLNLEAKIPALLCAGEYDLVCNWLGNSRWVEQMNWSGQKDFGSAKTVPFVVDGKEDGLMKNHGPLTFLKVHDAGHMVPMDQPMASLQMLQTWMQGKLATTTGATMENKDLYTYGTSPIYDFVFKGISPKSHKIGVGHIKSVTSCSTTVYDAMMDDWMLNLAVKIPALVKDGINLLVYVGEYDLICNWLGNSRWVEQMNWSGQKDFGSEKAVPFMVDGKEAGLMKNHGPLTFLKVHDAGHMVPMDQPKASLQMLQTWMQGKLATPTGATVRH